MEIITLNESKNKTHFYCSFIYYLIILQWNADQSYMSQIEKVGSRMSRIIHSLHSNFGVPVEKVGSRM